MNADIENRDMTAALEDWGMLSKLYTGRQINDAGATIAAYNSHPPSQEVMAAFSIAHEWRDAHILPMRSIRAELKAIARRAGIEAQTSGRLKRFQSIRRKLRRLPVTFYQLQDLAGCRAIVESIDDIHPLITAYRDSQSRHEIKRETDYISAPKAGGYRSTHFVLKFNGEEEKTHGSRLTAELQIRTRLQHAWATAVEAVGTVRNEDLKSGAGDERWLRFFELMSGEFAAEEGCAIGPNVPQGARERRQEIISLERELDAVVTLEGYRKALREIDDFRNIRGSSFLIQFDSITRSIKVMANRSFSGMTAAYWKAEEREATNAVFVEVDRVNDLVSAYPNYFLDVEMFTQRLRGIIGISSNKASPIVTTPVSSDDWLASWVARSERYR